MQTTLSFYSGSADKPAGTGAAEILGTGDFTRLNAVRNWRRILSNFHCGDPFDLDERRWASVEHYFQANKFVMIDRVYYETFTLGANRGPVDGIAALRAGRAKRMTPAQCEEWGVISPLVMAAAREAKFRQNPHLVAILRSTQDAILMHKGGVEHDLMQLRDELRAEQAAKEAAFAEENEHFMIA